MRPVRRSLVVLLTAVLGTVAMATPARAENVNGSCNAAGIYHFNGWVYYTTNGAYHEWYQAQYELLGHSTGGKSNVNFWIRDGVANAYSYYSPDSLQSFQLYTISFGPVLTSQANLEWGGLRGDLRQVAR